MGDPTCGGVARGDPREKIARADGRTEIGEVGDKGRGGEGSLGELGLLVGDATLEIGEVTLEVGDKDSTSVSSVFSLSAFLRKCTVDDVGAVDMLMVIVSPGAEPWESVGLCGGVSVSWIFSRSPIDTLLVSV